ncbi:MAG: type II secretion system protein GspE, partial [Candidatus Binatia bacterium]
LSTERGEFLHGSGCNECRNIGYRGRVAITELAEMTGELRELVCHGEPATRLREAAVRGGMITLLDDGIAKARAGRTTIEEVLRVCSES